MDCFPGSDGSGLWPGSLAPRGKPPDIWSENLLLCLEVPVHIKNKHTYLVSFKSVPSSSIFKNSSLAIRTGGVNEHLHGNEERARIYKTCHSLLEMWHGGMSLEKFSWQIHSNTLTCWSDKRIIKSSVCKCWSEKTALALAAVTSCRQLWQLLQAVASLENFDIDSPYKLSLALIPVSWRVNSLSQALTTVTAVASFASFARCFKLLAAKPQFHFNVNIA